MAVTLYEHAQGIADALAREWETPTGAATRSWHALFEIAGSPCYATLTQTRGVPAFRVRYVRWRFADELQASVTAVSAAIWLGLDVVDTALDWHHEL